MLRVVTVVSLIVAVTSTPLVPKSCNGVPKPQTGTSVRHVIDPDGPGGIDPFTVECDFSTSPPANIIHHNKEQRMYIKGYEADSSYVINVTYDVAWSVMTPFIDSASACSQYLKTECRHTGQQYWSWRAGNGSIISDFFPGGNPQSKGCACHITGSCASKTRPCNCMMNDNAVRYDEGNLTTKSYLPIKSLLYGDTGHDPEFIYSTLGPLKCFFDHDKPSTNGYSVNIFSGNKPGAGTDADVYITLYGETGSCGPIKLDNDKNNFEINMVDKFALDCTELGRLNLLRMNLENSWSAPGWFLDKVTVEDKATGIEYMFPCNSWLAEDKDEHAVSKDLIPSITYNITIHTGNKANAGTNANVYITLFGENGSCGPTRLNDEKSHFQKNKLDQFSLNCNALGRLNRFRVSLDNSGLEPSWFLEKVTVEDMMAGTDYNFPCGRWLGTGHTSFQDLTPA